MKIARTDGRMEQAHHLRRNPIGGEYLAAVGESFAGRDDAPLLARDYCRRVRDAWRDVYGDGWEPGWSDAARCTERAPRASRFCASCWRNRNDGLDGCGESVLFECRQSGRGDSHYFDYHCVGEYEFPLPENVKFKATMIDPWAMTGTPLPGTYSGKSKITLSGKPYMAVLFENSSC